MTLPDRLPSRRPFSHGSASLYPVPVDRRLVRAEAAACADLSLHELDVLRREIKADREVASNQRVVERITSSELTFYDEALELVGMSPMKHRRLADRMSLLVALNDDVVDRFRR